MALLPILGGCAHIDLNQLAYEILRQEDCRLNRLDDFCTRTFAHEYREYVRQRREFLRSHQESSWQLNTDRPTLEGDSLSY